jgi:hypothetical protein
VALHDPAVIERTCVTLTQLVTRVNAQLSRRNAELEQTRQQCWQMGEAGRRVWFDAKARHDTWKAKACGWKREAEARLLTAKEHRRRLRMEHNGQHRDDQPAREALRRLALAVHHHQRASRAQRIDPEPHDRLLWAALQEIEVPYGGISASLHALIDTDVWM